MLRDPVLLRRAAFFSSLLFLIALALAGCRPAESESSKMGQQLMQWVPFGTSLPAAQQIMQTHGFVCTTNSFDGPEEMTNRDDALRDGPLWRLIVQRNGKRYGVTNISYLDCARTNTLGACNVRFILLNGETARCRASGAL